MSRSAYRRWYRAQATCGGGPRAGSGHDAAHASAGAGL